MTHEELKAEVMLTFGLVLPPGDEPSQEKLQNFARNLYEQTRDGRSFVVHQHQAIDGSVTLAAWEADS